MMSGDEIFMWVGVGAALSLVIDLVFVVLRRIFPGLRFRYAMGRIVWLPANLRRAVAVKTLNLNRITLHQKGITLLVVAEDQVALVEDLRSYEQGITALRWMARQAGEVAPVPNDNEAQLAWPENFTGYTGPRGDYVAGVRVGDGG